MSKGYGLFFTLVILLHISCGVEEGNGKNSSFEFNLTATCQSTGSATQCSQSINGVRIKAYAVLDTCNTLFGAQPDTTEISNALDNIVGEGSGNVFCSSSVCTDEIDNWASVTQQGSVTMFVIIDSDNDNIFGEAGEPFACEDGIPFNDNGSDILTEASATIGYFDIL